MVLQNKYKARASRRYQVERGLAPSRGESSGRGRGRGKGRGRGRGRGGGAPGFEHRDGSSQEEDDEEDEEDDDDDDDDDDDGDEDQDEESGEESTGQAGKQSGHTGGKPSARLESNIGDPSKASDGGSALPTTRGPSQRSKYAKRKLESNTWRFEHPSDEEDPDAEPEPEVDLTAVFAKARLDHAAAESSRNNPAEEDNDDNDVDESLAYLLERQRNRAAGSSGRPSASSSAATAAQGQRQQHSVEMPQGYEEAQQANRELRERNDARLKLWGRIEDELGARRKQRGKTGADRLKDGSSDAAMPSSANKPQSKTLEGQDFLDSMLA
ncbi:unnamed protein product [Parajaminaea phylloscopi]